MNWFHSLTRGKQIALSVLAAHTLLLCVLLGDYWVTRNPLRPKKIAVKNIRYSSPQPQTKTTVAVATPTKTAKPSAPKEKAAPTPAPKKGTKKSTSIETKQASPKPKEEKNVLLEEIAKNLNSIAAVVPAAPKKSEIAIPTLDPILHFTSEPSDFEPTDAERIALLLQELLQLPEYGEVKVELKIDRFGRLESCAILESRSAKNEQFLKKALPEVQFPCLNETAFFTIVFRNAN
jgi:hypothetical protein